MLTEGRVLIAAGKDNPSAPVITEVYTANAFLQTVTLLALIRWAHRTAAARDAGALFLAFAFLFGLSAGTHLSNLGFAPGPVVGVAGPETLEVVRTPETGV